MKYHFAARNEKCRYEPVSSLYHKDTDDLTLEQALENAQECSENYCCWPVFVADEKRQIVCIFHDGRKYIPEDTLTVAAS